MMSDVKWDDVRVFLAIAREGSLTAAGKRLNISQSTVSRRLFAIEQGLGARLFDHSVKGYGLTAAGKEILEAAQIAEVQIARINRGVVGRDTQVKGRIRVTCTDNMANLYLVPHLARFVADHPEIDLELITRYEELSLARHEVDVAIRSARAPSETLIGRRLPSIALSVYAASHFVETLEQEPDPAKLNWIGWDKETTNRFMITDYFPTAKIRHRVDNLLDMHSLTREGLGVAVLGCFSADPDPGLSRVYACPKLEHGRELWILSHRDMHHVARIREFTKFIANTILADRDLFEGRRSPTRDLKTNSINGEI
jgi:DNA-binding transcriptional LysR family regulator